MAMISRERRDKLKSFLIRRPTLFRAVRRTYIAYAGFLRELFALFHFAPRMIKRWRSSENSAWKRELPVQQPLYEDAGTITPTLNPQQIKAWCSARQLPYSEGEHAIYLPPATWRATPLGPLLPPYPAEAGLKIVRHAGGADTGRADRPHRLQTLNLNFHHVNRGGPRLYDLLEIRDGAKILWTAYVVEHAPDAPHGDDAAIENYGDYLRDLAKNVTDASHFGSRLHLVGDRTGCFLYQEIPGLESPAKRSPRVRLQAWDPLLQRAGVSIEGKVIFDIGCNLGLMGAEYLRRKARWIHGWDRPEVVDAAYKILLAVGCTRFSLTGATLDQDSDLFADIPEHLKSVDRDDAILSYLSVRDHVGWLAGLPKLPWRYMLYEGHPDDRQIDRYIAELNERVPIRLLTTDRVSDSVGGSRDIALVERLAK